MSLGTARPESLAGVRRIVTGHREDGVAVVKSDTVVISQEVRGLMVANGAALTLWRGILRNADW